MCPSDAQLAAAFDKGTSSGPENLTGVDREFFLIQEFILSYEMGSLSGYFYNQIPNLDHLRETVASMKKHGISELAEMLGRAVAIFDDYREPNPATTWENVLKRYDPDSNLDRIDEQIGQLENYGIAR